MKRVVFFLLFIASVRAQDGIPEWATNYLSGGMTAIDSLGITYYGIGASQRSYDESDQKAFVEFASQVKLEVSNIIKKEVEENEGEVKEHTQISTQLITNVPMQGMKITARYYDAEAKWYLSFIQVKKTDYYRISLEELKLEIEKEKQAVQFDKDKLEIESAKKQVEEVKLAQEREESLQREKREVEELKNELEKKRLNDEQAALQKERYKDFFEIELPDEIIYVENASTRTGSMLLLGGNLFPFGLAKVGYSLGSSIFELKTIGFFEGKNYRQQSAILKIKALSGGGDVHKISIAFGVSARMKVKNIKEADLKSLIYSPAFMVNILFPEYYYSIVSLHIDKMQFGTGLLSYPFFDSMKGSLAFFGEFVYLLDDRIKNDNKDTYFFQPGIQFQANEDVMTKLSFQQNKHLAIELILGF
ncbi:MAG: hypothetical protein CO025_02640 [Ignavibacteria bacterium CG_4_9_14_0_2_um_filter_37_13]|nr:MAG: hypothetical protein CO025_02640 [Ignavibacteria bacterium CG_4_9_14_0_2_um_filter_37_13]